MLRIYLFGEFFFEDSDGNPMKSGARKAQLLFAYLLLHQEQPQPRERIADIFWPDSTPKKGENSLRQALFTLRRLLADYETEESPFLLAKQKTLQINPESEYWLDTEAFEDFIRKSEGASGEKSVCYLKQALELYRSDLLEGCYDDWCLDARSYFQNQYLKLLNQLADHYEDEKDYDTAIDYARQSLAKESTQEHVHVKLMLLYYVSGNRAAAIQQFRECKRILKRELNVNPLPETLELLGEIEARSASDKMKALAQKTRPQYPELGTPFVGRLYELEQFTAAWNSVLENQGQALLINGEAGVGKSRLAEECIHYAMEHDGLIFSGRSYEIEGKFPYQPLMEALRNGFDRVPKGYLKSIPQSALSEVVKLDGKLKEVFPKIKPSARHDDPQLERSRQFDGLCQFLLAIAKQQPVMLFLDDLQWADDTTIQFIHYLVRHIKDEPFLFLGAYRTDEVDEDHPLWEILQHLIRDKLIQVLPLEPLDEDQTGNMVHGLLNADEGLEDFGKQVYEQSKGIPFFAEALVESFIDGGTLSSDAQGQWHIEPENFRAENVPATVSALVGTRLRRLNPDSRQILDLVAVAGRAVNRALLSQMAGKGKGNLFKPLDNLLWSRFLEKENHQYRFRHDMIRQALYGFLPSERRKQLHLDVGQSLEAWRAQADGDSQNELLGELSLHFCEAEAWEKSLDYSIQAGRHAWEKSYSKPEALRFFNRSLKLATQLKDQQRLLQAYKGLGEVHCFTDEHDEGEAFCEKALELDPTPEDQADIFCSLANVYDYKRDFNTALSYCQKAMKKLESSEGSLAKIKLLRRASNSLNWLLRYDEAIEYCSQALQLLKKNPDSNLEALILSDLGHAYSRKGNYKEAAKQLLESAKLTEKNGNSRLLGEAVFKLAVVFFFDGKFQKAISYWERVLDIVKNIEGSHRDEVFVYNWLIFAHIQIGKIKRALQAANQLFEISINIGDQDYIAESYGKIGCLEDVIGDKNRAKSTFEKALRLSPKNGVMYQGIILTYLSLNKLPEALDWLDRGKAHLQNRHIEYLNTYPPFTPSIERFRESSAFQELLPKT